MVAYKPDKVDSRAPGQDGIGQLHILSKGARGVVAAPNGIGSCNDRAARLQTGHNASLGNGDALLLHCLHTRLPLALTPAMIYQGNDETLHASYFTGCLAIAHPLT